MYMPTNSCSRGYSEQRGGARRATYVLALVDSHRAPFLGGKLLKSKNYSARCWDKVHVKVRWHPHTYVLFQNANYAAMPTWVFVQCFVSN